MSAQFIVAGVVIALDWCHLRDLVHPLHLAVRLGVAPLSELGLDIVLSTALVEAFDAGQNNMAAANSGGFGELDAAFSQDGRQQARTDPHRGRQEGAGYGSVYTFAGLGEA